MRQSKDKGINGVLSRKSKKPTVLIIPGLDNSGPLHWQSLWETKNPEYLRVQQRDWQRPQRSEWVETLGKYVAAIAGPALLAAHSLGCAAVVHWAATYKRIIRGALLVSPSDVESPDCPAATKSFSPMPLERLPFPSVVVASNNDPYVTIERARHFAHAWGSRFVNIGACGHINADAGFGEWPEGEQLLRELF